MDTVLASNIYMALTLLVAVIAFAGIWIYAVVDRGVILGGIFGAIPAAIGSLIAACIWPLAIFIGGGIFLWKRFINRTL